MTTHSVVTTSDATLKANWARWLIVGAVVAGTCDISYATTFSYLRSGVAPSRILQSVASGLLGQAAYEGGAGTAALGLALHFLNAFIFTSFFFAVAAIRPELIRRAVPFGILYGVGIYGVMNFAVIPLSRIGHLLHPAAAVWISGVLVHMFLIGLPISFAARRAAEE
jgi:hypothetical protein